MYDFNRYLQKKRMELVAFFGVNVHVIDDDIIKQCCHESA